jgi:hypothetical protein
MNTPFRKTKALQKQHKREAPCIKTPHLEDKVATPADKPPVTTSIAYKE